MEIRVSLYNKIISMRHMFTHGLRPQRESSIDGNDRKGLEIDTFSRPRFILFISLENIIGKQEERLTMISLDPSPL